MLLACVIPTQLQRWLYCREHLKYVWNVYCVVTNDMRDLHTTETTGHERFPRGHGTIYFRFVLTFSFFYKQTITFPTHLFYSMFYSEEYRFERFWNKLQSRCAGRDACDGLARAFTRLWKTKHPRKCFQNFRQSCVLLTNRIQIHQSQPDSMT